MTPLKPFQLATVEAAFRALTDGRKRVRRFLVADEVGLGKTVVAQHVLKRLMDRKRRAVTVLYVCSSLSIAGQNRDKLLQVLPAGERKSARCEVDRLTLLPASAAPMHPRLRLYSLTPDTSVPVRQGRRRDGRQEERALLQALVEDAYPGLIEQMSWSQEFFQRSAQSRWSDLLVRQRSKVADSGLRTGFRDGVRQAFDLQPGQWLSTRLREIRDPLEVIARFRNALAIQALSHLSPDLVIFDEFQRFRDLIDEDLDEAAARVVRVLRGDTGSALLMLSATPYSLLTSRAEDANGAAHHHQLLDLVEFLYGRGDLGTCKAEEARQAFGEIEQAYYQGSFGTQEAREAVGRIEALLSPVMARTERMMHPVGRQDAMTSQRPASLHAADLRTYRHLAESLQPGDRAFAAAYWSSIPLPTQTMGSRYEVWQRSVPADAHGIPGLTAAQRNRLDLQGPWPHPKLRSLMDMVGTAALALPWVSPSLPWWTPGGPWRNPAANRGKVLVFSRFRAVPPAVSSVLSYELERRYVRRLRMDYADIPKRRMLQATGERIPLIVAFHPCTVLAKCVEPLAAKGLSRGAIRGSVRQQLTRLLRDDLGVRVTEARVGRQRPVWQLIAGLEQRAGVFGHTIDGWRRLWSRIRTRPDVQPDEDSEEASAKGLAKLIEVWAEAGRDEMESITHAELDELAWYAWSAPGVVVGRALGRHWSGAFEEQNFDSLLAASWQGLRTYLDQRWFAAACGGSERNYLKAIHEAVIDGNLEAVLDEWFWLLVTANGRQGPDLCDEILAVARLRGSDVHLHELGSKKEVFTLRAHAALPFVDVRHQQIDLDAAAAKPLRNDELRRAFNSPFFPHVLTTTSVGQEGLDFHAWCRTVVHWDLAPNAADLEQREGRIQRFAGLAVRHAIAARVGKGVLADVREHSSPWAAAEHQAEQEMGDPSGMAPWWVCSGAQIERVVLDVPTSEQRARFEELQVQRGLYRALLGLPYQEDMLAALVRHQGQGRELSSDALLTLSPYFTRDKAVSK